MNKTSLPNWTKSGSHSPDGDLGDKFKDSKNTKNPKLRHLNVGKIKISSHLSCQNLRPIQDGN